MGKSLKKKKKKKEVPDILFSYHDDIAEHIVPCMLETIETAIGEIVLYLNAMVIFIERERNGSIFINQNMGPRSSHKNIIFGKK